MNQDVPEILLCVESSNIVVPCFPPFKKPSLKKRTIINFLSSPSKLDDNISGSTKISVMNVPNNYIVNHHLATIKKHLNQPTRSEVEGQIVKHLISSTSQLQYMLHMDWAKYFTQYLQHKHQQPPGPINNTSIFEGNQYKQDLKQDVDYVLLNKNTWMFVHQLYGGGPEVSAQDYVKGTNGLLDSTSKKPTLSRVSSMQSGLHDTQSYMSVNIPFQKSLFELPPVGLYNESNYCFMHAALQSLLTVEQMNCWVLGDGKEKAQQNPDKFKWLSAYLEIASQVSSKKPGAFIKVMSLKNMLKPKFDPKYQHDSQEFLRYFIDQLSQEIQGQEKYDQPVTDIVFQGQMMQLITCQNCQFQSSRFEYFLDLSVSMNKINTLDGCLKQFFAQEFLSDNYLCENCNTVSKAIKKYVVGTPPNFLMIHLKRFSMYHQRVKLHGHVQFPMQLDVQEFCSIQARYKLRSIIVHYGTPERGHYVNFSLRQNQWYYFDDHKIYTVTESDVLQQQAYVLFYEKAEEYLLELQ